MAKQRNINIVYKVNTQEVSAAKAQVESAKKSTDALIESTKKYETSTSAAYKKSGISIQDMQVKLVSLKEQILQTNVQDSKRLDMLLSKYKLLNADVQFYNNLLKDQTKTTAETSSNLTSLMGMVRGGIYGALIKETVQLIGENAILAGKIEGVKIAFDKIPGATKILNDMRRSTQGMVDDYTLMQRALQAKNFKIPLEEFSTLLEFATIRAQQTGQEVDYLVDSIVRGIGMQSVLRLDNLGISASRLREQFKGVSMRSLEISEVTKGVSEVIKKEMQDMGNYVKTSETSVGNLTTAWKNLKNELSAGPGTLGGAVADWFGQALNNVTDFLKGSDKVKREMAVIAGQSQAQSFIDDKKNKDNLKAYDDQIKSLDQLAAKKKVQILLIQEELKNNTGWDRQKRDSLNEQILMIGYQIDQTNANIKVLEAQRKEIAASIDEDSNKVKSYKDLKDELDALNKQFEEETSVNDKKALAITGAKIKSTQALIDKLDKLREANKPDKKTQAYDPEQAMMDEFNVKNDIFLKQLEDFEKGMVQGSKKVDEEYSKWYNEWLQGQVKASTDASDQEEQNSKDSARRKKHFIKELRDYAIQASHDVLVAALTTREIDFSSQEEAYKKQMDALGNNENAKRRLQLKMDSEKERAEEKNKAIRKKNALITIAIDTAANVVRSVLENGGIPAGLPFGALALAMGMAQAATVRKYKDGVIDLDGPGTETSDSIPARLSKHESVMTASETKSSKGLLEAIRAKKLNDRIFEKISKESSAVVLDTSPIAKAMGRNKVPDLVKQGGFIYEMKETGKNTKRLIRSKSFSM